MVEHRLENFFIKIYKNLKSQNLFYSYYPEKKKIFRLSNFYRKIILSVRKVKNK